MKKLLILLFLVVDTFLEIFGQSSYIGAYSIPPSPDASALVNSINTPVDMYSGTLGIHIPLCELVDRNINVPIALSYQASGIKVEDISTWVGLGWRLGGAGKITRVVRHYPDEQGYSSLTNNQGSVANNLKSWTTGNFESRLKDMDTEPDIFYFEIPGRSGMFVVNYDQSIYTIPFQQIAIEWVNKEYFILTDENGVKYKFGSSSASREVTQTTVKEDDSSKNLNFVSTWFLESIINIDNSQINFTYVAGSNYEFTTYNSRVIVEYKQTGSSWQITPQETINMDTKITIQNPKYLSEINCSTGKLKFITKTGRQDLVSARYLSEIQIYSVENTYLKSILFNYTMNSRVLNLKSIQEISGNDQLNLYDFEYYTERTLPSRNSYAYDHWGYYNGANNTKGYPSINRIGNGNLVGDDRNPNLIYAKANTIRKMYNSSGGYKEFEYELNERVGGQKSGGLRISKIREKTGTGDELLTSYTYSDQNDRPGGYGFSGDPEYGYILRQFMQNTTLYAYCAVDYKPMTDIIDINGVIVGYPKVKETHPNGSYTQYYFDTYQNFPDMVHLTYDVIGEKYYGNTNLHTPNTSRFWMRGRLVKTINYDMNGNEVSKQEIKYRIETAAKKEIKGYIPYYAGEGMDLGGGVDLRIPMIGEYKWISQPLLMDTLISSGKDEPVIVTTSKYDSDYLVPTEVLTICPVINMTNKKIIKYPFQYNTSGTISTGTIPYAIKCMKRDHMISTPIETIEYENGKIVGGIIMEYKVISANGKSECIVPAQIHVLKTDVSLTNYTPYTINSNGTLSMDSHYEIDQMMDYYDSKGNLLSLHTANANYQGVIYGYNRLPIAQVENAFVAESGRLNEVFYTSFEEISGATLSPTAKTGRYVWKNSYSVPLSNFKPGTYVLTYWKSTDGENWQKITSNITVSSSSTTYSVGSTAYYMDELQVLPAGARMTTCTYLPGVGKNSQTDYNGMTTYYEYDRLGRLVKIKDDRHRLLKEYKYFTK